MFILLDKLLVVADTVTLIVSSVMLAPHFVAAVGQVGLQVNAQMGSSYIIIDILRPFNSFSLF